MTAFVIVVIVIIIGIIGIMTANDTIECIHPIIEVNLLATFQQQTIGNRIIGHRRQQLELILDGTALTLHRAIKMQLLIVQTYTHTHTKMINLIYLQIGMWVC